MTGRYGRDWDYPLEITMAQRSSRSVEVLTHKLRTKKGRKGRLCKKAGELGDNDCKGAPEEELPMAGEGLAPTRNGKEKKKLQKRKSAGGRNVVHVTQDKNIVGNTSSFVRKLQEGGSAGCFKPEKLGLEAKMQFGKKGHHNREEKDFA